MTEFLEEELEEETWAIRPNKSQLKRDIAVIHKLCDEIVALAPAQMERLELPDNMVLAMQEAAKMPLKSARKRQMKFITGIMRKLDIEAIETALAKIQTKSAHAARELHQLERWRDRLLTDDKHAVTEFLGKYPNADVQQLRQLIRNAKKEQAAEKPPKSARQLFRYLRELLEESQNAVED
ncbi:MAG: DUF615 domain-containing protein [Methyloprofundus sp.]|nr:DUF615 domain-containing protein [Methyloprofundus sp.]